MFGTYQDAIQILIRVTGDVVKRLNDHNHEEFDPIRTRLKGQYEGLRKAIDAIQAAWDAEAAAHAAYNETLPLNTENPKEVN